MYEPSQNLLEVVTNAFQAEMMPWDEYFMRMAETDFLAGRANVMAAKTFFIRKAPFGGSYASLAGVTEMLRTMSELRFSRPMYAEALADLDYDQKFIDYLQREVTLKVRVFSAHEGTPVFPQRTRCRCLRTLAHDSVVGRDCHGVT